MALTPRLDLRQSQNLVMTPQLQQAIKLLQLSNLELSDFVEKELEENPMLEREDANSPESGGSADQEPRDENRVTAENSSASNDSAETETAAETADTGDSADTADHADDGTMPGQDDAPLDTDYENLWSSNSLEEGRETRSGPAEPPAFEAFSSWRSGGSSDFSTFDSNIEQTAAQEVSLRDHLLNQLTMDVSDPADRVIGLHLIDMLDEAGYLGGDLEIVSSMLGCDTAQVEGVLELLRRFDPPGIFARGLADCLALQLCDKDRLDPAMQALLDNLDLLGKHDVKGLIKACGVDQEDLTEMVAEIRALNPKPALSFDHDMAQTITPDVLMRVKPKGGWGIELNAETLPRVLVNNTYYAELSRNAQDKKEKDYIAECYNSANWLVKSLHQRATTILRVATEIIRQQDEFFTHGVQHLKPLILRDIAEAIDMHESTVSRVTANKYIATPRGNYELKYFFTSAIAGAAGKESHSAEAVRHRIKALIDDEKPKEVLSDDRIVEILKSEGVDIARRTIAKYREAMHIPSSIQRRREKNARF
ncbi:MAG: RNA polymerase factor sigma-54 [Alphaproteobacteria bacterium]|nr:RNA polymerase factor sigma-54 [Alphaproteobacteria bacterium]